jgi:hypothetical protein
MTAQPTRSLEEQRKEFSQSRFLAMPIAGAIAWTIIGITSPFVSVGLAAWILFICTGMILWPRAHHCPLSRRRSYREDSQYQRVRPAVLRHRADGVAGVCDCDPLFLGRAYIPTAQRGHPGRTDVVALLVDHPALDRHLPRLCAYSICNCCLVSLPGPALCGDPCYYCHHLSDHDLCTCKTTATLNKGDFPHDPPDHSHT